MVRFASTVAMLCLVSAAVMRGDGVTNQTTFIDRALSSIRGLLEAEGQMIAYERSIAPATSLVRFAKSLARRVTGSMNDLVQHATACLAEGEMSQCEVGLGLNDILLSMLARSKSIGYGTPREALMELIASGVNGDQR